MRKLLLASSLLLAIAAHSQPPPARLIVFAKDDPCCKIVHVDGVAWQVISDGDVSVMVAPWGVAKHGLFSASIIFQKDGDGAVEIIPSTFTAVASDTVRTPLGFADMDSLAADRRKRQRRASMIAAMLGGAAAGASQQQTTVRNSDGTSSTVTYHDPSVDAAQRDAARSRGETINAQYAKATSSVLRENTLIKGRQVGGLVYFAKPKALKDKKAVIGEVDIPVGGTIYRFR